MQPGTLQPPTRLHALYGAASALVLGTLLYLGAHASPRVPARVAVAAVLDRLLALASERDLQSLLRELPSEASVAPDAPRRLRPLGPALRTGLAAAVADPGWSELYILRRELREGLSVDRIVAELDLALLPAGQGGLRERLAAHHGMAHIRLEFRPLGETWQVTRVSASPLELRPPGE